MNTTALFPRKKILNALGYFQNASRSSWSHDDGERIYFDAWINRYDEDGLYPMCTADQYPRPDKNGLVIVDGVKEICPRGLTMWHAHTDLILHGKREPVLINPVPRKPGPRQGNRKGGGAKGWLPRYTTGEVIKKEGEYWFRPKELHHLDLDSVVEWKTTNHNNVVEFDSNDKSKIESRTSIKIGNGEDAIEAAKALLQRHLIETNEMLKKFE